MLDFESLPADVQVEILYQLDSVTTLFQLLKASSRFLYIYQINRGTVFPKLVYKQIGSHAIKASRLRRFEIDQVEVFRETLYRTIDHYDISISNWRCLYSYHCHVDELIQDSAKKAFEKVLEGYKYPDQFNPGLSVTEYRRLVKAFYNWEFMTSLYNRHLYAKYGDGGVLESSQPRTAQRYLYLFQEFVDRLELHEMEEIYFVACYFQEKLHNLVEQAESERFKTWRDAGPYEYRYEFDNDYCGAKENDRIWSKRGRYLQEHWMGHMLCRGTLAEMHQVVGMSGPMALEQYFEEIEDHRAYVFGLSRIKDFFDRLTGRRRSNPWCLHYSLSPRYGSVYLRTVIWPKIRSYEMSRRLDAEPPWEWSYFRTSIPLCLLNSMAVWGAPMWDSERVQTFGKIIHSGNFLYLRYATHIPQCSWFRGESVETRARVVEEEWIAKGLTKPTWKSGLTKPYWESSDDEYNMGSDYDDEDDEDDEEEQEEQEEQEASVGAETIAA